MEIALILEVENTNVVSYKPEDSGSTQIGTKHVHDCISMYVVILVRGLDFARLPAAKQQHVFCILFPCTGHDKKLQSMSEFNYKFL